MDFEGFLKKFELLPQSPLDYTLTYCPGRKMKTVHEIKHPLGETSRLLEPPVVSLNGNLDGTTALEIHDEDQVTENERTNWLTLIGKIICIFGFLYFFICALSFLSDSMRLISGPYAGEILQKEKLLNNPIVGLMIGILITVLLQSSSTSTSIIIAMVSSGLISLRTAISMIMGSNLGTSVTNSIVALTHLNNKENFERAFSGAVLHDMFNLLTIGVLLPLEYLTRYLEKTSKLIMDTLNLTNSSKGSSSGSRLQNVEILSHIVKPFTSLIVQINKKVIIGWSLKDPKYDNARLLKVWCNSTAENSTENNDEANEENQPKKCKFLFNLFNLGDFSVGIWLLIFSLILLCGSLICLVKVLSSMLKGKLANAVQRGVNANIPYMPFLTGYIAIFIGAILTILLQSSSVFTSSLTPLIAIGVISLDRAYPLTLGSNLGTTTTSMLASISTVGPHLNSSIQVSLCHFLFNFTGLVLFYPFPFTRFPIRMAQALGKTTNKYNWFAFAYLLIVFLLLPFFVFTLSLTGPIGFSIVSIPLLLISFFALILTLIQTHWPSKLPEKYQNWEFLPSWLHSLEPYDKIIGKICGQKGGSCGDPDDSKQVVQHEDTLPNFESDDGLDNPCFYTSSEFIKSSQCQLDEKDKSLYESEL